jgi:hypothetical protein
MTGFLDPTGELPDIDAASAAREANLERAAEEAADRIKRGQHWLDWLAIGEGLVVGRLKAMRRAGTNQPQGAPYNRAFGDWMDEHRWARDLDKATRNHAMWAADNRAVIEAWRETLAQNVRAALNHPTSTKRRYEATTGVKAEPKEKGETKAQRAERELEAVAAERDKWKRQAEADGSLFDLRKDPIKDIAHCIALNVTTYRLAELLKALKAEADRIKAEKRHAG